MSAKRASGSGRPPPLRQARVSYFWIAVSALLAIAVVVGLLVAALGGDDSASDALEVADAVTVTGGPLPVFEDPAADAAVGLPAPTVAGVDFDEVPVATPAPGAPYAVVLLAHWCPHCQAEVPRIVSLANSGGTSDVPVVAVSTAVDENQGNYPPSEWLERENWPFPVVVDDADGTAASAYGLADFPMIVFVDGAGNVVARVVGEVPEEELATMFAALAAGESVPVSGEAPSSSG